MNHEFLADEAVLAEYANVRSYQLLLLDTISQGKQFNLTSSFNYSITKKRLAMMIRIKNLNRQYAKQAAVALLAFVLTFTFSEKIYSQIEKKAVKALPEVAKNSLESNEGLSQEEMAEFKNTIEKHTTYITNKRGRTDPMVNMDTKLEDRMHALFIKMSPEQNEAA
ncbi:hypothetical protein [Dyadobacter arcticus]|uniref:Uncharacterized protein n=1 Tax=Dyadobacter arcticus TaxID=1078754 RepID=A0ABX0UJ35_9BACT|nr:hypothetical protein [Dyadobacter arcticus]NIJ53011.1 hypothetical protein [Dyadobacter arcticus]